MNIHAKAGSDPGLLLTWKKRGYPHAKVEPLNKEKDFADKISKMGGEGTEKI